MSEVILYVRNLLGFCLDLLLHQKGDKSHLAFIVEGVKFSSQVYLNMLEEKVLPWLIETFENNYIFPQDGAPALTANATQK